MHVARNTEVSLHSTISPQKLPEQHANSMPPAVALVVICFVRVRLLAMTVYSSKSWGGEAGADVGAINGDDEGQPDDGRKAGLEPTDG